MCMLQNGWSDKTGKDEEEREIHSHRIIEVRWLAFRHLRCHSVSYCTICRVYVVFDNGNGGVNMSTVLTSRSLAASLRGGGALNCFSERWRKLLGR